MWQFKADFLPTFRRSVREDQGYFSIQPAAMQIGMALNA